MTARLQTNHGQNLYHQDYFQWLNTTVEYLKQKEFTRLDLENLIEEIESLSRSERRAIKSNLIVVVFHLLKWRYQPEKRSNSWKSSIREHRRRIQDLLADSPSLKNYPSEIFTSCYIAAKKQASDETGLSIFAFPTECPYSLTDCLNEDFLA